MSRLPSTAVSLAKGHITIDAELLAPKLGLSVTALRANMAKGLVTSLAESGIDDDAGRTRLTFRYRSRVWRLVREADGTLREDPVPSVEPQAPQKRSRLLDLASGAS